MVIWRMILVERKKMILTMMTTRRMYERGRVRKHEFYV